MALKLGYVVRTFQTETHHHTAVRLEEIGGSSFRGVLSTGSDSVARASSWSDFGDQEPGFTVVGTHAAGIAYYGFACFFDLECGFEWQRWFQHATPRQSRKNSLYFTRSDMHTCLLRKKLVTNVHCNFPKEHSNDGNALVVTNCGDENSPTARGHHTRPNPRDERGAVRKNLYTRNCIFICSMSHTQQVAHRLRCQQKQAWANTNTKKLDSSNCPTEIDFSILSWDSGGELSCTAYFLGNTVCAAPMYFEKVAMHSQRLTRNSPLDCIPSHLPAPISRVEFPVQSAL